MPNTLAPTHVDTDEDFEDDVEDETEGHSSENVTSALQEAAGIYELSNGKVIIPPDCHEMTIVNVSSVHRSWVKWCNCHNARSMQEDHLL